MNKCRLALISIHQDHKSGNIFAIELETFGRRRGAPVFSKLETGRRPEFRERRMLPHRDPNPPHSCCSSAAPMGGGEERWRGNWAPKSQRRKFRYRLSSWESEEESPFFK